MPQLLSNERLLISTRQSWTVVLPGIVAAVIIAIVVEVGIGLFPASVFGIHLNAAKHALELALALVVVVICLVRYLRWRVTMYHLTTHRIIENRGVISTVTESLSVDRIQDVIVRQNLGDRMLGRGTIEIQSAGRDGTELLRHIPHAQVFYTELMEVMQGVNAASAAGAGAPPPQAGPVEPSSPGGL